VISIAEDAGAMDETVDVAGHCGGGRRDGVIVAEVDDG
jgi:hypothetical protein